MLWIILVLIYGIIKGLREVLKKKALERNTTLEVLLVYTILSFLIVTPEIRNAGGVEPKVLLFVAIKSLTIFYAWRCGFEAIAKLPISLFGVLDLSRVIFSTLLGVIVLHETMSLNQIIGLILVLAGLMLLRGLKLPFLHGKGKPSGTGTTVLSSSAAVTGTTDPNSAAAMQTASGELGNAAQQTSKSRPAAMFVIMAFISCLLNAVSGLFDKLLMTYTPITDGQLQFWYMAFLVVFYLLYILVKRPDPAINWKSSLKNYWIWILAVLFVIADRCLFIANSDPASKVTVMTLLKQSGVIIAIICGRFMFREKHTGYRMFCAAVILTGIFISVL